MLLLLSPQCELLTQEGRGEGYPGERVTELMSELGLEPELGRYRREAGDERRACRGEARARQSHRGRWERAGWPWGRSAGKEDRVRGQGVQPAAEYSPGQRMTRGRVQQVPAFPAGVLEVSPPLCTSILHL